MITSDSDLGRLLRFGLVGGLSTMASAVLVWTQVDVLNADPRLAAVIAYLLLVPVNFLGQRRFTFASSGRLTREALRFILVHVSNLMLSLLGMVVVVDLLRADYRWGIVFSMIAVPLATFLAMQHWVFRRA